MIVLDASVALKWFVDDEPLVDESRNVLEAIGQNPRSYLVPELFMNEVLAVLVRLPGTSVKRVTRAVALIESLGLGRIGNGHELLEVAAKVACDWRLSGYDAVYVAAAVLTEGTWLTADDRAARRVRRRRLVTHVRDWRTAAAS